MIRVWKWIAFVALGGALLVASGMVDVRVSVRDRVAGAMDLFGDDEAEAPEAPASFWKEGGEPIAPAPAPAGAPTSFADLAERVSPAIVNIQTRRAAETGTQRQFEEVFGHEREALETGQAQLVMKVGVAVTELRERLVAEQQRGAALLSSQKIASEIRQRSGNGGERSAPRRGHA